MVFKPSETKKYNVRLTSNYKVLEKKMHEECINDIFVLTF